MGLFYWFLLLLRTGLEKPIKPERQIKVMTNKTTSNEPLKSLEENKARLNANKKRIAELDFSLNDKEVEIARLEALSEDATSSDLSEEDYFKSRVDIKALKAEVEDSEGVKAFMLNQNKNLRQLIKEETEEYKRALYLDRFDELKPEVLKFNEMSRALIEQGEKINSFVKDSDLETAIRDPRSMRESNLFAGQCHWDLVNMKKTPRFVINNTRNEFIPMTGIGEVNTVRQFEENSVDYEI